MDIPRERREIIDILYVLFAIEDGLIKMRDRPTLGDVEAEELGKLRGCARGHRVAPGAEGDKQLPAAVKGHIAVHHGRNADGAGLRQLLAEFLTHVAAKIGKAGLQAAVDLVERIGPHPVDQAVFPAVTAGGDRFMLAIEQDGLDAGRAELDAEHSLFLVHFLPPLSAASR